MHNGPDLDLVDHLRWARDLRGLSDNTLRVRADVLHRLHAFIGVPLRQAEVGHLLRFERACIAGRSPETRRSYVVQLRAFYRWALAARIVADDPTVMLTMPLLPRHLPRPISEADLARALATARPKLRAMITLAAYAGLRCKEIIGLDWTDLRTEPDGRTFLHVREGKGARQRTIEVGQIVVSALRAHGVRRRGPVFIGRDGSRLTPRSASSSINRHLDNLKIAATAHQLRHRYATVAYRLSHDLRMVQELLGHSSPVTTAGYAQPSEEAAKRMVAALDALALPEPRVGRDPADSNPTPERTAS